jgi:hypothetical protein
MTGIGDILAMPYIVSDKVKLWDFSKSKARSVVKLSRQEACSTKTQHIVECALANSIWLNAAFGSRGAALQLAGCQIPNLLAGRPFSPPSLRAT